MGRRKELKAGKFSLHKRSINKVTMTVLVSLFILITHFPPPILSKASEEDLSIAQRESLEEDPEEMPEYLDDEVRFVTDDDFLYEEEQRSHYRDFHQGAMSGSNRFNDAERCPELPQPSTVASSGLCESKRCQRDEECSKDGSVICCYNGCVYTCLQKNKNPPLAFDWIEETDLKFPSDDHKLLEDSELGRGLSTRALLHAEISPEASFALPGGCYLNSKQYHDLIMFRKFDHVKACSCSKGEVFCEINHQTLDVRG